MELNSGDVIRYAYLWAREAQAGEVSGRKGRPVCVVVRTPLAPAAIFVFALTSQRPEASRPHIVVPEIECRRGGLDHPSYLIVDEYNRFLETEAFDLESPVPIGAFSAAFLRRVAVAVKEVGARRRLRGVNRG